MDTSLFLSYYFKRRKPDPKLVGKKNEKVTMEEIAKKKEIEDKK